MYDITKCSFIHLTLVLVKVHASDDIDACLAETAGHAASTTEKVNGFERRSICLVCYQTHIT